jgi:hypothetical protein
MLYKNILAISFCLLITLAVSAQNKNEEFTKAEDEGWLVNLEEAYKISKETNKPILANFTGTDWCVWCKEPKYSADRNLRSGLKKMLFYWNWIFQGESSLLSNKSNKTKVYSRPFKYKDFLQFGFLISKDPMITKNLKFMH